MFVPHLIDMEDLDYYLEYILLRTFRIIMRCAPKLSFLYSERSADSSKNRVCERVNPNNVKY